LACGQLTDPGLHAQGEEWGKDAPLSCLHGWGVLGIKSLALAHAGDLWLIPRWKPDLLHDPLGP